MDVKNIQNLPEIVKEDFGTTVDGKKATLYTLSNENGVTVKVTDYGATVQSIIIPTKSGQVDVCLGYDNVSGYEKKNAYPGCLVGRVCNRIAKGKFTLNGKEYTLDTNNEGNHLHGGLSGFSHNMWTLTFVTPFSITLTYNSPDGDQRYPGAVTAEVTYTVTHDDAVLMRLTAKTTEATPLMLTNHAYFNLNGHDKGSVADHTVQISGNKFTKTDAAHLVTGEVVEASADPDRDFRQGKLLKSCLDKDGFDNYYFDFPEPTGIKKMKDMANVTSPAGISMAVRSNDIGVQFYTAKYLDEPEGKGGAVYKKFGGLCLEVHGFPDAVNHPEWPSNVLQRDETYDRTIIYQFSWK